MNSANSNDSPHADDASRGTPARKSGWFKLVVLAIVIAGLFIAGRLLPLGEYLESFLSFVKSLGIWGPVVVVLVYIVASVLMVPGSIITLGAGFAFGLVTGTITVMVGSVLGALASFLVGRTIARGFVEQKARENPRFAAIDRAVEREGFKIVLLTRLSPIFPFNLLNYLFSITKVRLRDYLLASWLGMIPGTIMYVYIGSAAKDLTKLLSGDSQRGVVQYVIPGIGLIATVAVTFYITRIARKALRLHVPTAPETDASARNA